MVRSVSDRGHRSPRSHRNIGLRINRIFTPLSNVNDNEDCEKNLGTLLLDMIMGRGMDVEAHIIHPLKTVAFGEEQSSAMTEKLVLNGWTRPKPAD